MWVIVIRGRGTLGIGHGVHVNLHRQFQKEIGLEINSTICQGAYDLRLALHHKPCPIFLAPSGAQGVTIFLSMRLA